MKLLPLIAIFNLAATAGYMAYSKKYDNLYLNLENYKNQIKIYPNEKDDIRFTIY